MASIRPLDPALVNKIAAGEVIERPASVVKELAENALDAGATRIDIAVEEGGAKLIRVTDNGPGIPGAELALAVAPHATSKIATVDDLFSVRTLGFRGEALASIASVSRFHILSRTADQLEAYELRVDTDAAIPQAPSLSALGGSARGGKPQASSGPLGTTVEVRSLFYNVPARRKFLRQPATELANITEQLARLALAHPNIAFTLTHNGRELRNLPATNACQPGLRPEPNPLAPGSAGGSATDYLRADTLDPRRTRIADFYGPDLAACLLPVARDERGLRIEALIAPPAQARPSTKWQYLFLNGRFITDRRIAFAVRESFRGLVERERFPVVFLFLTCPPDAYDVNVHPTKIEVRWRDAGLVQSQVLAVLRETLLSHDLTPSLGFRDRSISTPNVAPPPSAVSPGSPSLSTAGGWGHESDSPTTSADARQDRTRQALADYLKSVDPTQARLGFAPPRFPTENLRPSIRTTFPPPNQSRDPPWRRAPNNADPGPPCLTTPDAPTSPQSLVPNPSAPAEVPIQYSPVSCAANSAFPVPSDDSPSLPQASSLKPQASSVLQVHNTYLIAETDEGVIIIDQHALHERILYERFRERILAGPLESQRLLMAATLEASPAQIQAAADHHDLLARLGIEVSAFGKNSLAVQSFPTLLPDLDAAAFVSDLLDKLSESGICGTGYSSLTPAAADVKDQPVEVSCGAGYQPVSPPQASSLKPQVFQPDESLLHRCLDMMACKAAIKAGDQLTTEEMQALLAQRHLTHRASNCPHGRPTTLELTTRDLERQFKRI